MSKQAFENESVWLGLTRKDMAQVARLLIVGAAAEFGADTDNWPPDVRGLKNSLCEIAYGIGIPALAPKIAIHAPYVPYTPEGAASKEDEMEITPESTIEEKFEYVQQQIRAASAGVKHPNMNRDWRREELRKLLCSSATAEISIRTHDGWLSPSLIVKPSFSELGVPISYDIALHIAWLFSVGLEPSGISIGNYWARLDEEMCNEIITAALNGARFVAAYKGRCENEAFRKAKGEQ